MATEETGEGGVTALAEVNAPVFEALVQMTPDTLERSRLDQETYLLARIAALVAMDASAPSCRLTVGTAAEIVMALEKIQGTVVAIAPLAGARVVSAARAVGEAFGPELPTDEEQ